MEVINIFLAGSTKLEVQRNLVRSCANKLQADNCAKGRNIVINITTFENFSSAITNVKAQELYDAYIHSDADYAMFIFDDEVGGISMHEFNVAYDAFEQSNRPALYIYFRKSDDYCAEYKEIRNLLENTNNYFLEYTDLSDLAKMIDNHLREIIEPSIEKIIIDAQKEKGYLTLIADTECHITENGVKIADIKPDTPHCVELAVGVHTMIFIDKVSSRIIEKRIRVIKDNYRTINVNFVQAEPESAHKKNYTLYYILSALFVILTTLIIVYSTYRDSYMEVYPPDEIEAAGGKEFQDALLAIEQGDVTMAIELLQTVINFEPNFADPYIHLASIYIQQGNTDKAKELLLTALSLNPDSPWGNELYESIK